MDDLYNEIAWAMCNEVEIDIEQARTLLRWFENEGLTDYDMMKEWYWENNDND